MTSTNWVVGKSTVTDAPANATSDILVRGVYGCEWARNTFPEARSLNYEKYFHAPVVDEITVHGKVLSNWVGVYSARFFDPNAEISDWETPLHTLLENHDDVHTRVRSKIVRFTTDDTLVEYKDMSNAMSEISSAQIPVSADVTRLYFEVTKALIAHLTVRNVRYMKELMEPDTDKTILFSVRTWPMVTHGKRGILSIFLSTSYNWVGLQHGCFDVFGDVTHILIVHPDVRRVVVSPNQKRDFGQYHESEVILEAKTTMVTHVRDFTSHDSYHYVVVECTYQPTTG